jgi:hypothetical protein
MLMLSFLSSNAFSCKVGERIINGSIEAFSCKKAGEDKKLSKMLEQQVGNI